MACLELKNLVHGRTRMRTSDSRVVCVLGMCVQVQMHTGTYICVSVCTQYLIGINHTYKKKYKS
jgi:hypothetical protein